jgi:predicted DNA-binding antitoxin AbrB/MazE fold protein
MIQAIEATYKNGVFVPRDRLDLPEGKQVTLWVADIDAANQIPHLTKEDREFIQRLSEQRSDVFRRLAE